MKLIKKLLLLVFLTNVLAFTQSLTVSTNNIHATVGEYVLVPINVTNFDNVGAISVTFTYDSNVLEWVSSENWHSSLVAAKDAYAANGKVIISYFDVNGVDISGGKLVDQKFRYLGGSSPITFLTGECEIADIAMQPLATAYTNGSVNPNPPAAPVLTLPENNSVNIPTAPQLSWSGVAGTDTYDLQVSTTGTFATTLINESGLTATTYNAGGLSTGTKYYWRVRGVNTGGAGEWSTVWNFTTVPLPPGIPVLLLPEDNALDVSLSPTLSWNTVANADSFNLQVSTDQAFTQLVVNRKNITTTSSNVNGLNRSIEYFWRVSAVGAGGTGEWSAFRKFTTIPPAPAVPELSSPVDNSTDVPVNSSLNWGAASGAVSYTVQISLTNNFSSTIVNQSGITATSYIPAGLNNNTMYYWRVNAVNAGGTSEWSTAWNFTTIVAVPGTVILSTPGNNSIDITLTPILQWNSVPDAATYELQVALDEGFSTKIIDQTSLTNVTYNASGLNVSTRYYWKVRAVNLAGNGAWSQAWNFTTLPASPPAPVLVSPENNALRTLVNPMLDWNPADGAVTYHVQVSTSNTFVNPVVDQNGVTITNYNATGLLNGTTYYWRVRGINAGGNGIWSEVWNFTTKMSIPQLLSPANNSIDIPLAPTLTWGSVTAALTYNLQVSKFQDFSTSLKDESGLSAVSYNLSSLENGMQYYWRVKALNSTDTTEWSQPWKFTAVPLPPGTPVLTAPDNNATTVSVNPVLSWNAASRAVTYDLQVSLNLDFSSFIYNLTGITATSFTASLNNSTKYYWRVKSVNGGGTSSWSDIWNFTTVAPPPGTVTLLSPANNSVNVSLTPSLSWTSSGGTSTYMLQVSSDSAFANKIVDLSGISQTSYSLTGLNHSSKYYWRVRSSNNGGSSNWSVIWNFITVPPVPGKPELASPANNSFDIKLDTLLTWNAIVETDSFDLQVSEQQNFNTLIINQSSIKSKEFRLTGLSRSTTYYWRLREVNVGGPGQWTDAWKFTTIPQVPGKPALISPENNLTNLERTQTFAWTKTPGAISYEIQLSLDENFDSTAISITGITDTVYQVADLDIFSIYYWRIRAINTGGTGEWSDVWHFKTEDFIEPPSELVVDIPEINHALVRWMDNSDNEDGFKIERKLTSEDFFTLLIDVPANIESYTDTTIEENTSYTYRLKAFNENIESENTNDFQVLTPVSSLIPPHDLVITLDSTGTFILEWEDNSDNEEGFIVERRMQSLGEDSQSFAKTLSESVNTLDYYYVPIDTLPPNSENYIDSTVSENFAYNYRVLAFNSEGVSIAEPDTNSQPVIPLIAPSYLLAILTSDNSIRLEWLDNSTQETNYLVERKDSSDYLIIADLPANSTIYEDINLEYHKTYHYRVCAYNNNSRSAYTNETELLTTPVELTAFSVEFTGEKIILNWETATETNNKGFEVERQLANDSKVSYDNKWENIGFVKSEGTSTISRSYSFVDNLMNMPPMIKSINYRLKQIDFNGDIEYSDIISVGVHLVPVSYSLSQNYPNPFNPSTIIKYELPEDCRISLAVYNILGDKVLTVEEGYKAAGSYEIVFNAINLANSVYFYELKAGEFRSVKKMILLK